MTKPKTINEDLLPPIRKSIHLEKWSIGDTGKQYFLCWATRNALHRTEITQKTFEILSEVLKVE